jgi:flagella basal body P-ring formation protein FlgA
MQRGQRVNLIAGNGGFEVRSSGRVLSDAAVGDLVRVENLASKKIVEGLVTTKGDVRVVY